MSQLPLDGLSRATDGEGLSDPMTTRHGQPGRAARSLPAGTNALPFATRSRPLVETVLPVLADEYLCPGETHPISHSVHVARLSSFYSKCRACAHRGRVGGHSGPAKAAGQLIEAHPVEGPGAGVRRAARTSLLETDGVRGIYLNELDRPRAAEWGAALASMLWDETRREGGTRGHGDKGMGRQGEGKTDSPIISDAESFSPTPLVPGSPCPLVPQSALRSARPGPTVVIGFDERPASPDIVTGVALGLRRMGCQVIDLGQTAAACFRFAVPHLDAAAGMFVTGAGCDPAWTGFDIVERRARPWSTDHKLEELEARARVGVLRPTRTAGSQRTFQALVPYEAGLWKHFHALRPLHVVCGSATKQFPRIIDRLFSRQPCRVTHVALPVRRRDLRDEQDRDVRRVGAAVVSGGQHLGLIVDDDGQRCAFVTERGRLISPGELARILIDFERREHHGLKVVATAGLARELAPWLMRIGIEAATSEESAAAVATALVESEARLGLLNDGRVWWGETPPACDAIVTLAHLLQALSLSDASCGDVVSRMRLP